MIWILLRKYCKGDIKYLLYSYISLYCNSFQWIENRKTFLFLRTYFFMLLVTRHNISIEQGWTRKRSMIEERDAKDGWDLTRSIAEASRSAQLFTQSYFSRNQRYHIAGPLSPPLRATIIVVSAPRWLLSPPTMTTPSRPPTFIHSAMLQNCVRRNRL